MIEKRYRLQEADYHVYSDILDENGEAYRNDKLVDVLNEKDERIQRLENKLNQTALELLKYGLISMGKAVEISEMSYYHFLEYRAEHGIPMELQL